jgi:hypothetical protein
VSTGLQDFSFLSRHVCLKEHGWTADNITGILPPLEPLTYDSQWRSLAKLLPAPLRKSGVKICTSL